MGNVHHPLVADVLEGHKGLSPHPPLGIGKQDFINELTQEGDGVGSVGQ